MKTIGFGSCNRQNLDQSFWRDVQTRNQLDMWLWTGDAYYAANNSVSGMHSAIKNLTDNVFYRQFLENVTVAGVWDDHDYGINDAGRLVDQYEERRRAYSDFLQFHPSSSIPHARSSSCSIVSGTDEPCKASTKEDVELPGQDRTRGLYSSIDVKLLPSDESVDAEREDDGVGARIIFLDTRSFRDSHFIRSVGELHLPFTALLAASIRTLSALLRLGRAHPGDILGEAQWQWLEQLLCEKTAPPFTVLVSSVQVLTSNPAVESWGHFPAAKRRLMDLLGACRPSGLLLISGDVHYAETLAMRVDTHSEEINPDSDSESESAADSDDTSDRSFLVHEVTSSGLTHSCTSPWLTRVACPQAVSVYSRFRCPSPAHVYTGRNYGTLRLLTRPSHGTSASSSNNSSSRVDSNSFDYQLQATVYSMESHEAVLTHTVLPRRCGVNSRTGTGTGTGTPTGYRHVSFPETFFSLSEEMAVNAIITAMLFGLVWVIVLFRVVRWILQLCQGGRRLVDSGNDNDKVSKSKKLKEM